MTTKVDDVVAGLDELGPSPAGARARVEWANEKLWDFAEGLLSRNALRVLAGVALGWADLGTDHEKTQYRTLARKARELAEAAQ